MAESTPQPSERSPDMLCGGYYAWRTPEGYVIKQKKDGEVLSVQPTEEEMLKWIDRERRKYWNAKRPWDGRAK